MTNYLTNDELAACQQPMINAPYLTQFGVTLNQYQVAAINRYTVDINNERDKRTRKVLLDNRHKYFCLACGIVGF